MARRVRALRGTRPRCNGRSKFRSLYVFGFVHPATGRSRTLVLPWANTAAMGEALADFARRADPAGRKVLVVVVDNAGWRVAEKLAVPPDAVPHRLPPRPPELQPAEPLWPPVRGCVASKSFATPEERGNSGCRSTAGWSGWPPTRTRSRGRSASTGPWPSDSYASLRSGISWGSIRSGSDDVGTTPALLVDVAGDSCGRSRTDSEVRRREYREQFLRELEPALKLGHQHT